MLAEEQRKPTLHSISTQLAFEESYGFFDYIPDDVWKDVKQYAQSFPTYKKPNKPLEGRESPNKWFQNNLEPIVSCLKKQRVGGLGDGPKWVCDPKTIANKPGCLIYSVGSHGMYDFEDAWFKMSNKNCEIHTFDFGDYARAGDAENKNIHYHQWGLGSEEQADKSPDKDGNSFKTFEQTVEVLGHENRTIDLFKIDCEGCEFKTYKGWTSSKNVRQINVEVHKVPEKSLDFFNSFAENHLAMYSKEFNAIAAGNLIEYSFIRLHPDFWKKS